MKVQLNKNPMWKVVAWFMLGFCVFAIVSLTFNLVTTFYELIRVGFSDQFAIYVWPTVSYASFLASFLVLACQWKKLRLLLADLSCEIDSINNNIERRLLIKCIICLIGVLIFVCFEVDNTVKILLPIWKFFYHSNVYNSVCFGCNFSAVMNEDFFKVYIVTFSVIHGPSVFAIKCFQVFPYCFLAIALADITKQTLSHFGRSLERGSLQNLTSLRRRFHRLRKLVDRLNLVFKNVVLFWLASTLLTTCRHITDFVTYVLDPSKPVVDHRNAFFWISQLMDLVLLVSLIWVASRLPEECDNVHNYLPYLSDVAASDSKGSRELMLFYQELSSRKLALHAGSCFVITKNLLLSFVGLAVTYTIVFIQFKPHLLNKLAETHGNFTQKN